MLTIYSLFDNQCVHVLCNHPT